MSEPAYTLISEQIAEIVQKYHEGDEKDDIMAGGEYNPAYQWYQGYCEALLYVLDLLGIDPDATP